MYIGIVFFFRLLSPVTARAQSATPGQVEVRGITGYSSFLDESSQNHFVGGGSAQFYLTRRFSVGPEVLYMYRNEFDKDVTAAAQFAWDFMGNSRVQPYVAGHVGALRQFAPRFSVNSPTYGAGLGVKVALADRLALVPDFRLGVEPILRATLGINYVIGR